MSQACIRAAREKAMLKSWLGEAGAWTGAVANGSGAAGAATVAGAGSAGAGAGVGSSA